MVQHQQDKNLAASDLIQLDVVTPESVFFSKNVGMAILPGVEGQFGVMRLHAPMLVELQQGVIGIYKDDVRVESLSIGAGFAEVTGETCTVLVEKAETE